MSKKILKNFHRKKVFHFWGVLVILLILELCYFALRNELRHRLPFGLHIAKAEYSLAPTTATISKLQAQSDDYLKQPLNFQLKNQNLTLKPEQIGLVIEVKNTLIAASQNLLAFGELTFPVRLDEAALKTALLAVSPDLELPATEAKITLKKGKIEFLEEKNGQTVDWENLVNQLKNNASHLSHLPVVVTTKVVTPKLKVADIMPFQTDLEKILATPLILKDTEYKTFQLNLADHLDWLDFQEQAEIAETIFDFAGFSQVKVPRKKTIGLQKTALENFLKSELAPAVEKMPTAVKIAQTTDGKIIFTGIAATGRELDQAGLFHAMEAALTSENHEITLPFRTLPAPITTDTALEQLGITELIGEASTDYAGSPQGRQHNIQVAADKINGYLLESGAEFSFIAALGPVTPATGYTNGLVIKKGGVEPEIGGGVCQVSTTIFRSALFAGLPITQQTPHSLKIAYYSPPGLDATIYPGQHDLRFRNDTGSHILIQVYVTGTTMQINFYGKNDGRQTSISGPFYPNGKPIRDLGKAGLRMYWLRKITQGAQAEVTEKYSASYRPAPQH